MSLSRLAAWELAIADEKEIAYGLIYHLVLPRERPSFNGAPSIETLAAGPERASAIVDLDCGRPIANEHGTLDLGEVLQRLADFVTVSSRDLAQLGLDGFFHAEYFRDLDHFKDFCHHILLLMHERWPHHVDVTIERVAVCVRDRSIRRTAASRGGRAKAARNEPASTRVLCEAIVRRHPGMTFGEVLPFLQKRRQWGEAEVRDAGGVKCVNRRWQGTLTLDGSPVKAATLEAMFRRVRREHARSYASRQDSERTD